MKNVKINNFMESEIIEVDQAIESFRDSGFDLSTACGEIIDNSYEANARTIRIKTYGEKDIDVMAFVDDGIGISKELMSQVLKLGFSTRYNNRKGLGRFGVGLKLASISMARRVDIYSKQSGDKKIYHSYLDLDLIRNKVQNTIKTDVLEDFPQELQELCKDKNNRKLESGTLLVWSKIDRLKEGGSFGNSNKQKISELRDFIARSYRKFIDQGLTIELNDKNVELFDPTFQLDSARTNKILETDEKGIVIEEGEISIDN
ncbi:ATP-binding protein, partial [Clostridium cadaveris]